ncbi:MAG: hypothetical protein L6Q57_10160, partial [Alphaproteobacteria bacterium]|nr:hypothetical protein [Alphaproteobacteria bacterium]
TIAYGSDVVGGTDALLTNNTFAKIADGGADIDQGLNALNIELIGAGAEQATNAIARVTYETSVDATGAVLAATMPDAIFSENNKLGRGFNKLAHTGEHMRETEFVQTLVAEKANALREGTGEALYVTSQDPTMALNYAYEGAKDGAASIIALPAYALDGGVEIGEYLTGHEFYQGSAGKAVAEGVKAPLNWLEEQTVGAFEALPEDHELAAGMKTIEGGSEFVTAFAVPVGTAGKMLKSAGKILPSLPGGARAVEAFGSVASKAAHIPGAAKGGSLLAKGAGAAALPLTVVGMVAHGETQETEPETQKNPDSAVAATTAATTPASAQQSAFKAAAAPAAPKSPENKPESSILSGLLDSWMGRAGATIAALLGLNFFAPDELGPVKTVGTLAVLALGAYLTLNAPDLKGNLNHNASAPAPAMV